MADEDVSGGRVTFTTKELIARIDSKLDHVVEQMDAKASSGEVEDIRKRIQTLELTAVMREGPLVKNFDDRINDLSGWHQRQLGIITAIAFVLPVMATVSWHLWGG